MLLSLIAASLFASSTFASIETTSISSSTAGTSERACTVQALVRAEDLYPNAIANGDLRIKVNPSCTDEIESVALRLQLNEFSEVKFLKEGATLPEYPEPESNQSVSDSEHWRAPTSFALGIDISDYNKYQEALDNPELWVVKAEERTAWTTSVTLAKGSFAYDQPRVMSFKIAVPNVNFPPGEDPGSYSSKSGGCETNSKHAYRYIADVKFSNGRSVEIPAGYTTFIPTITPTKPVVPFVSNVTFGESSPCGSRYNSLDNCISDQDQTIFGAQVTLDSGNVYQPGDIIKGRVIVYNITTGSTAAEIVSVGTESKRKDHWAIAQAARGGDSDTGAFTHGSCFSTTVYDYEVSADSCYYSHIFGEEDERCGFRSSRKNTGILVENKFDFEAEVSKKQIRDFHAYHVGFETSLQVRLDVSYPDRVRRCMFGDDYEEFLNEDTNLTEAALWDMYTPVRGSQLTHRHKSSHSVLAHIPIVILGRSHPNADRTGDPPVHYLTTGSQSLVLLAGDVPLPDEIPFPLAHPVIDIEPIENTTQRMLKSSTNFSRFQDPWSVPNPARTYHSGPYAGLLWKKKVASDGDALRMAPAAKEGYERSMFQVPFA